MYEASTREILSNIQAYRSAPWGEESNIQDASEFLGLFREHPGGFVRQYRDAPENEPYLYIHGIDYRDDIEGLIQNEFTGENAYYHTNEYEKIARAMTGKEHLTYIGNIHADKSVEIADEFKPRLKILPELILELLGVNQSDAVVLYTHRNTGVYRAIQNLQLPDMKARITPYSVDETSGVGFNRHHAVDALELITIQKAR